ncbi:MAG: MBL fold metallo-hydrolase [FCB group bacterium]|nr:MBL fold metallo-hydrolase [FCB group bacterium]
MPNIKINIQSFRGGYDNNFTHLVSNQRTKTQLLIDAAVPLKTIQPFLENDLKALLITHTHGDHITYLSEYTKKYPALNVIIFAGSADRINGGKICPVKDGDSVTIGELEIRVLHTPGHYFDSLCFKIGNALFTGDTLFVGRTGRTISAGSNISQLYHSVYEKLLVLPGSTIIYPGHDYGPQPTITIRENIKISPLLQAVNEGDFRRRMEAFEKQRNQY